MIRIAAITLASGSVITIAQFRPKKSSEKVLGGFWGRVLRRVSEWGLPWVYTTEGFRGGLSEGFPEGETKPEGAQSAPLESTTP